MKLGDLLAELERVEHHQAVYDELVNHLDSLLDDDDAEKILVSSGDGVVPDDRVREVRDQLMKKSEQLGELLGAAEEVEVGDVELDFGDDGD